jgi:hypothetical protein
MLDCFFDNQSEMDQGIIELLLINQDPKLLQDDEKIWEKRQTVRALSLNGI